MQAGGVEDSGAWRPRGVSRVRALVVVVVVSSAGMSSVKILNTGGSSLALRVERLPASPPACSNGNGIEDLSLQRQVRGATGARWNYVLRRATSPA